MPAHRQPEAKRLWAKVNKDGPIPAHVPDLGKCWEWTGPVTSKGYGALRVSCSDKTVSTHRLAWQLANGDIPPEVFILHRCDNRRCVNPNHLFLGDAANNADDRESKNRTAKGERSTNKLTVAQVLEIRSLHRDISQADLSAMFGVTQAAVSAIIRRKNWKHV